MSGITPSQRYPLEKDVRETLLAAYNGKHYKELPTPALVVKKPQVDANITSLLNAIDSINSHVARPVKYRAHIKTHKTIEGTRKQLGYDLPGYKGPIYSSIVVSTLREAYLVLDYQAQAQAQAKAQAQAQAETGGPNIVTDMLYGLPACVPDIVPELYAISEKVDHFRIFVDNVYHIEVLQKFAEETQLRDPKFKWSVFVKIDCGTHRAGVFSQHDLEILLRKLFEAKDYIELYGFYAHAGHSYAKTSLVDNEAVLKEEIEYVNRACESVLSLDASFPVSSLVLSVGASPTARAFENSSNIPALVSYIDSLHGTLELHAGNLMISDLQQVATGSIDEKNVASFVLGTVISQYPQRGNPVGEMLTNTGVLSMTKEVSSKAPGYGLVVSDPEYGKWYLQRLSQEHGILQPLDIDTCKLLPHGTKVDILMQHACITMACFGHYFVIDDKGIVIDVWIPCRGW